MRAAAVKRLVELARENPQTMLLTGDLGFGVLDDFVRELPEQFVNVGVAEQNMLAVAAGLALEGWRVFTYSIGNFGTLRCYEQLRNDICYHDLDVKCLVVGAGLSYGALGMSHHAIDDISALRALPGLSIATPARECEAVCCIEQAFAVRGPMIVRLDRGGSERPAQGLPPDGRQITQLREGDRAAVLVHGSLLDSVLDAADLLAIRGISIAVFSSPFVKPLDDRILTEVADRYGALFSVEEHTVDGGYGSAVLEFLTDHRRLPRVFRRIGLRGPYFIGGGTQQQLRHRAGLDAEGIAAQIQRALLD